MLVPVLTRMPRDSMSRWRALPPLRSSCADISRSEDCTTVHATSRPCSAPAASRPSSPPPITMPVSGRPSSRGAALHEGTQPLDVVERAVDEASVEAESVDGELRGVGAGREHQPVVRDAQSALRRHASGGAVDARDGVAAHEAHPFVVEHRAVEFELLRRRAAEEPGEPDAVVRMPVLFADDREPPVRVRPG